MLRLFVDDDMLSLTKIARMLDLHPSTAFRVLQALVEERLLVQDQITCEYQLGPESLALFEAASHRLVADRSRADTAD